MALRASKGAGLDTLLRHDPDPGGLDFPPSSACLEHQERSGKAINFERKDHYCSWEYLRHNMGQEGAQRKGKGRRMLKSESTPALGTSLHHPREEMEGPGGLEKGLRATRFHRGFYRSPVKPATSDEAEGLLKANEERQEKHREGRRRRIEAQDMRNEWNIITGVHNSKRWETTTAFHREVVPRNSAALRVGLERDAYLALRDSLYKFHAPSYSGDNHDRRQDLLFREGLDESLPRMSSVLGVGRKERQSVGVDDNFSESHIAGTLAEQAKARAAEEQRQRWQQEQQQQQQQQLEIQQQQRRQEAGGAEEKPDLGAWCGEDERGGSAAAEAAEPSAEWLRAQAPAEAAERERVRRSLEGLTAKREPGRFTPRKTYLQDLQQQGLRAPGPLARGVKGVRGLSFIVDAPEVRSEFRVLPTGLGNGQYRFGHVPVNAPPQKHFVTRERVKSSSSTSGRGGVEEEVEGGGCRPAGSSHGRLTTAGGRRSSSSNSSSSGSGSGSGSRTWGQQVRTATPLERREEQQMKTDIDTLRRLGG